MNTPWWMKLPPGQKTATMESFRVALHQCNLYRDLIQAREHTKLANEIAKRNARNAIHELIKSPLFRYMEAVEEGGRRYHKHHTFGIKHGHPPSHYIVPTLSAHRGLSSALPSDQ